MQQFDFPVRSAIPHMRPCPDEYNSRKVCNDADPCATLRQRVHRIYLAAPLDAQAGAKVVVYSYLADNNTEGSQTV
jgi:hypothetical protein